MKVRVHLNLANPARAENVVKVKTDTGELADGCLRDSDDTQGLLSCR